MSTPYSYPDWLRILKGERLPAAIVDLDAFDRNLSKISEIAKSHGKIIRLATKSVRVPDLISRVLKQGTPFSGLMCYSAEEAEFLHSLGFDDFVIAYPTVQRNDLLAIREIQRKGGKVSVVVDSKEAVVALGSLSEGKTQSFKVLLEVDVSCRPLGGWFHLGVRRSPIRSEKDLMKVLNEIRKLPGIQVQGVMAYEAQVAGLGDRNPFRRRLNPIARVLRKLSVKSVSRKRDKIARIFRQLELPIEIFNGGGTGSLNFSAREPGLTELSAGSGLLCPHLFDYYSNIQFEPACFFAIQAVRASDPGFVTCQGGGYIASGEPGWDKVPVPYLPEGSELVPAEACGEVQTPLRVRHPVKIGDPILFRHAKAGELAERFTEYLLVSQGRIVSRAKTYRGMNRCFF